MNIFGTEYRLIDDQSILEKNGLDGECLTYDKTINVRLAEKMLEPIDGEEAKEKRHKEVMRHEIIHAAFFESGLPDYCSDETLVNWLAIQFPKLVTLFKENNCL